MLLSVQSEKEKMLDEEEIRSLAAKLLVVGFDGSATQPNAHATEMIKLGAGGVILFGRNIKDPKQVAEMCRNLKVQAGDRPLVIMVDQEGGRVARLKEGFSSIPSARELSKARDSTAAASTAGQVLGRELRAAGIDMNLAPVMDVDTNPDNPVIGDRSFSRSATVVSEMGSSLIRSMQVEGVAACAKHFPGHGDTSKDSHIELPSVAHPLERLEAVEMAPFRAAIQAEVAAIMVAHVTVPALQEQGSREKGERVPASMCSGAVGHLRENLGYTGVVITDDMEMGALKEFGVEEAVIAGLHAGVDMFLVCHTRDMQIAALDRMVKAVLSGEISLERLKESVARVEALMEKYAMPKPKSSAKLKIIGSKEHRDKVMDILSRELK